MPLNLTVIVAIRGRPPLANRRKLQKNPEMVQGPSKQDFGLNFTLKLNDFKKTHVGTSLHDLEAE